MQYSAGRMGQGLFLGVFLLGAALTGCGRPQAMGDPNAIIVGVPDEVWPELQQEVESVLEPRFFTVRDERIFRVTQVDPTTQTWGDMRRFRQILLIGEPGDPWVAEALERVQGPVPAAPAVVRAQNVWAQGQQVTVALSPPGAGPEAARPLLPALGDTLLRQFQELARARMFATGADSTLADSLRRHVGFSLLLPNVYRGGEVEPNVFVYRNDQPDPSRLIRSVMVTWRPAGEVPLTQTAALQWRDELASRVYDPPQVTGTDRIETQEVRLAGLGGIEVQGVWSNPPGGWPAAGPFMTRLVNCPEQQRTYQLDGWLYAPGIDKYEYMVQINTILNSFTCDRQPRE